MGKPNECEGKTKYASAKDCKGVLVHLNKSNTKKMKCYRCGECKFWHVGHEMRTRLAPYIRTNNKIKPNQY